MDINVNSQGGKATVSVVGHLNTATAGQLEDALAPVIDSATEVMIDLAELEYISSAGLRVLLSAHKSLAAKGGSFTICNPQESVLEVFEITGLNEALDIE